MVLEIALTFALVFILSSFSYFLLLQNTVDDFHQTLIAYNKQKRKLSQKQSLAQRERKIQHQLLAWQKKNPSFYSAMISSATGDQLSQKLSQLFIQNGFTILQIKPIRNEKYHSKKPKVAQHLFQLKLSGQFKQLFSLLKSADQFQGPINLTELKINHANEFELHVLLRESNG